MNVREIVVELQKLDPDMPVVFVGGPCDDFYKFNGFDLEWIVFDQFGEPTRAEKGDPDAVRAVRL